MCAAASLDCDMMLYETASAVVQHQPLPEKKHHCLSTHAANDGGQRWEDLSVFGDHVP